MYLYADEALANDENLPQIGARIHIRLYADIFKSSKVIH